jgi:UDP-3-O-acyl-N-acetylglucosamine deacetylase
MSLIGKPIKGRLIATRPGHKINNQLARLIRKEIKSKNQYRLRSQPRTADGHQPDQADFCRIAIHS